MALHNDRDHFAARTVRKILALISAAGLGLTANAGQPFWETKDWTKWSETQCNHVLDESPWAQSNGDSLSGKFDTNAEEGCTAQFRSALPVRLALTRLARLAKKYDKMTPQERTDFDSKTQNEFPEPPPDRVVVHIECSAHDYGRRATSVYSGDPSKIALSLASGMSITSSEPQSARIKGDTSLNPGNVGYDVLFPRTVNGEPIVRLGDKPFSIYAGMGFPYPLKFDPSKMVFHGKLEY